MGGNSKGALRRLGGEERALRHVDSLRSLNGDFVVTVVTTLNHTAVPNMQLSPAPLYFSSVPSDNNMVGFSLGDGNSKGYLEIRMADGSAYQAQTIFYAIALSSWRTMSKISFTLECKRRPEGRSCALAVNGELAGVAQFPGVKGRIYVGRGGGFGSLTGSKFRGHLHHLSVCGRSGGDTYLGWEVAGEAWNSRPRDMNSLCSKLRYRWPDLLGTVGGAPPVRPSLLMLVGILSAPTNAAARTAIRKSWMTWPHRGHSTNISLEHCNDVLWDAKFVIGKPQKQPNSTVSPALVESAIKQEMSLYNDIIYVEDHADTYRTLSRKTIEVFKYARETYHRVSFVVKTDDDSFLNIPWFENFLLGFYEDKRVYMGEPLGHYYPNRDPSSQWYVNYDDYPAEKEESPGPVFMAGAAYLLSSDLTRHITKQVEMGAPLFPMEDVGTALLMQDLHVKPGNELDGKINVFGYGEKCAGANVVMHYVSRDTMGCLAETYMKEGRNRAEEQGKLTGADCVEDAGQIPSHCLRNLPQVWHHCIQDESAAPMEGEG
ncbi:hypothetical protein CYMTET_39470 [Cymbomonas tetramitiformis]|uniref:Uncharacterized protein n=1 Tax=Cymbomonas tetramitiformis TaxID=36881 RepID=A0AAE0F473_9CHLO|nr:hypothetical protein CYMTET_39470 [Cymbomonas tetramitiformis]